MSLRIAEPFRLGQIRLLPGTDVYRKTLTNVRHLLHQEANRLLYSYRVNAGLDTLGAEPYGGWENPQWHFRGHYMGHVSQGAKKNHSVEGFFCCNGSGVEYYANLAEGAFFHRGDSLWVTGYLPCRLDWQEQGVTVEEATDFPLGGSVSLLFSMEGEKELAVHLRIPPWAQGAEISLNGEALSVPDGGFLTLRRLWRNGDRLGARFPMALRTVYMPDRPEYVSVQYGPHLLVACNRGFASYPGSRSQLEAALCPAQAPCEFEADFPEGTVIYKPICTIVDETYNGYTIVEKSAVFRVVDQALPGDKTSEADHGLEGSRDFAGMVNDLSFRAAKAGGSFSLELRADADHPLYLSCFYRDNGVLRRDPEKPLTFNQCMEIDAGQGNDAVFAVQSLLEDDEAPLTEVFYPLPEEHWGRGAVRLTFRGSRYEGAVRGTPKLYRRIALGYFEDPDESSGKG